MSRSSSRSRQKKAFSAQGTHRVVSYNVLSSSLADPTHFKKCDPEYLDQGYRLDMLMTKLETEIKKGSVIALQEVSQKWSGPLHSFFQRNGYYFVCRHYGSGFNDYMGVGIAIPNGSYEVLEQNNKRVSDRLWLPRPPRSHWLVAFIWSFFVWIYWYFFNWLLYLKMAKKHYNAFDQAKYRWNVMVSFKLQHLSSKDMFWVSTYHMPCDFNHMDMMTISSSLALQHCQWLSGNALPLSTRDGEEMEDTQVSIPYILLGDFNFKYLDAPYINYLEGKLDTNHPDYPKIPKGCNFTPNVRAVRSCYKEIMGEEPEYTNNAVVRDQDPFMETLDYVFVSDHWTVNGIEELGKKSDLTGPFPDVNEPSDHVLIAANVSL